MVQNITKTEAIGKAFLSVSFLETFESLSQFNIWAEQLWHIILYYVRLYYIMNMEGG